jgi:UTP--glucose-1-phosphate uridylyltransferase
MFRIDCARVLASHAPGSPEHRRYFPQEAHSIGTVSAATDKMRAEGLSDAAVETFAHYERLLREGEQGMLPESSLEPLDSLPDAEELPASDGAALQHAVVLKLNGGLGTSMGMTTAKSLLEVKDGLTFLDVIVRQILHLRERHDAPVPLLLMNSFATQEDTLAALERYPDLAVDGLPLDFLQDKEPKLLADSHEPVEWPADPALEWAPPGHGDVYTALEGSGVLGELLERGYRYLFLSNSDNLGAVLDPRILDWFAREELPFLSESTDRTQSDRKGGHLARRRDDGGLVLRETAQTPDEDREAFEDVSRHRFFNCNNIWVDIRALERTLSERGGVLGLPMIVNRKTVDPNDSSSPAVLQLETAMGAAIGVFEGAGALRVPRSRFTPVKTTSDLLVVRSDAYRMGEDWTVSTVRDHPPMVELDPDHYKLLGDFEPRFPDGPPSLVEAERLTVEGDVTFGRDVKVRGEVKLVGPRRVDDGELLEG